MISCFEMCLSGEDCASYRKSLYSHSEFVEGEMYHLLKLNNGGLVGPSQETVHVEKAFQRISNNSCAVKA